MQPICRTFFIKKAIFNIEQPFLLIFSQIFVENLNQKYLCDGDNAFTAVDTFPHRHRMNKPPIVTSLLSCLKSTATATVGYILFQLLLQHKDQSDQLLFPCVLQKSTTRRLNALIVSHAEDSLVLYNFDDH